MKQVLILCTGNSCRSIMAEALINARLRQEGIVAQSAGTDPKKWPNPLAIEALKAAGIPTDGLFSKSLDAVLPDRFDLVVTVCDKAKESCPMFPGTTEVIHVGFEDPDGQELEAFIKTRDEIEATLLPIIREKLA